MTLAELILAHQEMGLGPHDEVLIGYDADGDGVEPYSIVAIDQGYLVIQPVDGED